jgi:tetratricopeptide (TPR) repeat protein
MQTQSLDVIGILQGTDKTSLANDYLRHYERILSEFRDEPIELLEIGIAQGASLRTWTGFMPHAKIIGVDIDGSCKAYATDRITVEIGSQADPEFLLELARRYRPSVIIDDGSHQAEHVMLTFDYLYPTLLQGGVYIMEDLYLHYGDGAKHYHRLGGATPAEYVGVLACRLAGKYLEPDCDVRAQYLAATIDRIEFIPRAIALHKRLPNDPARHLSYLWDTAEKSTHSLNWFHLSMILMTHNQFERAEIAAQQAVTMAPENEGYWLRLADAQARRGHLTAAVETLREANRRFPDSQALKATLSHYEARLPPVG